MSEYIGKPLSPKMIWAQINMAEYCDHNYNFSEPNPNLGKIELS